MLWYNVRYIFTDKSQPQSHEYPWGSLQYKPDSLNEPLPDTGVTRYYNFDVAPGTLSPDGYQKDMLLINGQFPGPLIEANWGDWVEVTVTNSLESVAEGTSIHWHGLRQYQTQFADGVPGREFLPSRGQSSSSTNSGKSCNVP